MTVISGIRTMKTPTTLPPTDGQLKTTRRTMISAGTLAPLGLSLCDWFTLSAAEPTLADVAAAKSCILIWLDGGPSHLETFDPKPDAPSEIRGPLGTTPTSIAGIRLCDQLPQTAEQMGKIALVRSVTSPLGEHNFASHYALSGYKPTPALVYPSLPSVSSHFSSGTAKLPGNIALGRPSGMLASGYLDDSHDPFVVPGDPSKPDFRVNDLRPPANLDVSRLARRRQMRRDVNGLAAQATAKHPGAPYSDSGPSRDAFERAFRLLNSNDAVSAFDVSGESTKQRQRYGNHQLGQSCLMARRLVEAGAKFVTVTDRGWDTHDNLYTRLKEGFTGGHVGKVPKLDTAYSALLADLADRGMLDSTLVLVMGEFGRTPKLNPRGGRDHWPRVFSVAFAGGGVPGGQVVGSSDRNGESPRDRAVTPADVATTIYHHLGINTSAELRTSDGRPVSVNRDGSLIGELA